ncbi:MAG: histidine--tRNA ligase [Cenarchaeum sp. SB0678_bin_8]|nr:histidine--tRNA ligase [Cenarchaeum sp. SB0664_bin_35]MXZ93364.1 histidine--tRNA ligase [Cenarchaeum sp. SB0666_bin_15]MYD58303.1 histidine--tRNA ligase [Cenarchaeum sp. SB0678_bin_8]
MTLPRGMKDISYTETQAIRYIRSQFETLAELYGYDATDPSPLEMLSTLETKSGEAIRKEIYEFQDKGGRHVGLRFDLTMGLTRYVAGNRSTPMPSKLSSFGGVFRYDEPQKNRYRYFHQWDIEIYGRPHMYQDVEIIEFTSRFFESLPLNVIIHLNHRKLVESQICHVFHDVQSDDVIPDMLRALDKTQKKSRADIMAEFAAYDESRLGLILDMAYWRGTPAHIEPKLPSHMRNHPKWLYLKTVLSALNNMGIHNIQIDFGIVRGLDYYTGMVFEVFGTNNTALAGGGRYDSLPGAFGRTDMGAAGVAGGVERIIHELDQEMPTTHDVAVMYTPDTYDVASKLASTLRQKRLRVRFDVSARPLKKQLSASSQDCRYGIIMGTTEIRDNTVILRDMKLRTQHVISYEEIDKYLSL